MNLFLLDIINQGIADGSAIVLVTDLAGDEITKLLQGNGLDTEQLTERGVLNILNKDSVYSIAETGLEAERLLQRWLALASDFQERSGCNSILAIGTGRVFFESHNLEKLIEYERYIGKKVGGIPVDAICYFDADSFAELSLAKMIQFLNYHEYTVYRGGVYVQWQPCMMLEIINKAIDGALGGGTSTLVQKTLKLVYGIDSDTITSQPEQFEEKLQKMFGKSADTILYKIQKQMTAHLSYLHKDENLDGGRGK